MPILLIPHLLSPGPHFVPPRHPKRSRRLPLAPLSITRNQNTQVYIPRSAKRLIANWLMVPSFSSTPSFSLSRIGSTQALVRLTPRFNLGPGSHFSIGSRFSIGSVLARASARAYCTLYAVASRLALYRIFYIHHLISSICRGSNMIQYPVLNHVFSRESSMVSRR